MKLEQEKNKAQKRLAALKKIIRKLYEDFADSLVWEWENKIQFNNEEKHMAHLEMCSKLQGSYDGFLDFKKHYKAWLYRNNKK